MVEVTLGSLSTASVQTWSRGASKHVTAGTDGCGVTPCTPAEVRQTIADVVLREVEQRLRVAERMAACIEDPRAADQITHTLADIIRFRLLMTAAGYEDGNDADTLRGDPMFKMALDLAPSDRELCSQPTISRLENLPDVRALLRMGRKESPSASLSTSTTLSMRCMAASNCGSSMLKCLPRRIWFSADCRVRWGRPLHHRRFAPGQAARRQGDQSLSAPAGAGDPRQLAEDRNHAARRQSLLLSRGAGLLPRQQARLHPRRRADHDIARACRSACASSKSPRASSR